MHYIVIRCIERKAIFKDPADRFFLDRLGSMVSEGQTICLAWALMTYHIHMLLKAGLTRISTAMGPFFYII